MKNLIIKSYYQSIIIATFVIATLIFLFSGCSDEQLLNDDLTVIASSLTRAAIDTRDFEWENLRYVEFKDNSNNTRILPAPWVPGSGMNLGVPKHFIDYDFDENSSQNLYSKSNGWQLLYHNLDLIGDPYKYLVLYNKYTGVARAFFLSMAGSNAVTNSNSTFIGFRVNGYSSLLNYTSIYNFDSSKKFPNSVFISSPTKPFVMTQGTTIDNFGVGFEIERWYAAEIEFAYDPTLSGENTLDIQITALQSSLSYAQGNFVGEIEGSIVTKASEPSSISLDLSNLSTTAYNLSMDENNVKTTFEKKAEDTSFLERMRKGASKWISDAFNKSAKELINGVFSMGSSAIVDAFGSLASSFISTEEKTQMNKVDLGVDGRLEIKTETITPTNGWGHVLNLPTKGENNIKIYPGNLGVWALSETPKFGSKFEIIGYYQEPDPFKRIIKAECKADLFQTNFPQIILNPDLENDYVITDIRTNICFEDNYLNEKGITEIFGNHNSKDLYSSVSAEFEILGPHGFEEEFKQNVVNSPRYSIDNLYSTIKQINPVYYFVSFKLEAKNDTMKDIFFSRYIEAEITSDKRYGVSCSTIAI